MDHHDEKLRLPLWWWPLGLSAGALLAAEIHLGYPGLRSWLPYAIVLPIVALGLWRLGRIHIRIADAELWVDDAHLPLPRIAAVEPLDRAATRAALGPDLHALAFVVHRAWVPGSVAITLDDPDDPTPYWIVSTRHPAALTAALRNTRTAESS
ncbi:MAG: DUF3093 domain-containing protein [Mycobacteriales bacterium]